MSGIIRRIDELGRIVIPKEIRKTLKIKNGETLDIEVKDNQIILKKYSEFLDIQSFLDKMIKVLGNIIKKDILLFDNKKIICQYKEYLDEFTHIELSNDILNILNKRREEYLYKGKIKIGKEYIDGNYLCSSIMPNGDIEGGIIIFSRDDFNDIDKNILRILTETLKKYIEE